ncbi:MAG: hypothetical protein EZS28_033066 [Streblomastix strix]|uniref:Uncharacterized protein n=1 Tax=Streblomastix strix TaxID=222440 RepID=A0A5J4UL60_9EUKA|nr:MAG: hypothetical protein EZS28_033066 [Streblomastix strix]
MVEEENQRKKLSKTNGMKIEKNKINNYVIKSGSQQIEEEGAIEEIESQMVNEGYRGDTKNNASIAKGEILNYFIEQGNPRPYWYNW